MDLSRLVALLAVPALASALVTALPDSARAVTPMCQGQPATIVGHGQSSLVGTAGDDVIVTGGAETVSARTGDDVVCVTPFGGRRTSLISADEGADRVVNTGGREVQVDLGSGSDTYVGGPRKDEVFAGDSEEGTLDERDVISTGAGNDSVSVGARLGVLVDDVDLGSGRDDLYLSGRTAGDGARFVGGSGSDRLLMFGPASDSPPRSARPSRRR